MDPTANFPFARGGELSSCPTGPPLLDRRNNVTEGLAYLGLCLTRHHADEPRANPASVSRQVQFDFNEIQDRDYKYFVATNDDGWLVGGGENSASYKLPNPDSAHCEIMRIGTFDESLGGVSVERIADAIDRGDILIPHMAVMPSFVLRNGDSPPEIELKFELERVDGAPFSEWPNWALQFVHNQLFEYFQFPGRFCPGPFHMTYVRKAAFRSPDHMRAYFASCNAAVERWRERGPVALAPETDPSAPGYLGEQTLGKELTEPHGVYLFRHRNLPIRYFPPNFLPPYDTPEKQAIIQRVLRKKWNEHSLQWEAC